MDGNITINTKRMRIMIGILGLLLPWLIVLITLSFPPSISATYYSLYAVGTFMVVLGSACILLINYKGYSKVDDILSTIAGIFGLIICLFPTRYTPDPSIKTGILHLSSDVSQIIHSVGAFGFFGALAFMSFFLFTKTDGEITKQKKVRNIIYRVCGIGMIASFTLLAFLFIPGIKDSWGNIIWTIETISLFFFGVSWIIKADAINILKDKDKEKADKTEEVTSEVENTEEEM